MSKGPDWDSITETSLYIHYWADRTFPGRVPERALSKLVMEEIPELLQHKKEHGVDGIGGELADCFVLLMDLAICWNVNLPRAIQDKMQINERRMWQKNEATGHYNHADLKMKVDPCTCYKVPGTQGRDYEINPECPIHGSGVSAQQEAKPSVGTPDVPETEGGSCD